jgi:hypothetical protein
VKKALNIIALIGDLMPGAMLVLGGAAVMVGGATGVLWL